MSGDVVKVRRALFSVSDKAGVVEFARALAERGVEIVSTGGTSKALAAAGIKVTPIEDVTKFPEMMDGRVKTLHPMVHGGLLAVRDNAEHMAAMERHGIRAIDLVCINLYPFRETIARPGVSHQEAIENIDIGGPSMVRSAAKNHAFVVVVTRPEQYGLVTAELAASGGTSMKLREQLAAEAFAMTAEYDAAIAGYMARTTGKAGQKEAAAFPERLNLSFEKIESMRYGENPHQAAALYRGGGGEGSSVVTARKLHGKELGYNNVADAAAALDLAGALGAMKRGRGGGIGACVIKHANPCGAAIAPTVLGAVEAALAGDPIAAFGGIFACSGVIDLATAERLCQKDVFAEVVVAQDFAPDALAALQKRWANVRLLAVGEVTPPAKKSWMYRSITGGMLVQERDLLDPAPESWRHAAGPKPSLAQLDAVAAVELMVRAMSSNAVAIGGVDGGAMRLFGGGVGQVDRVTACRLAVEKAGARAKGAVCVSDAFFPFPDGPRVLMDAGVAMIVHAGGSKRDEETFALCNERGVTCMVTGVRRFKH
ncbi:MAG: bifunctional phosphoribosylaminoimidazolecarboxamide formyltransferase/IMP cyclohydrolase [Phycisphaerales bacterium]